MAKQADTFKDVDIRKLPEYRTPVAEAAQCFLTKPSTEYDADGQYFVKIRLKADAPETKKLLKLIDKATDDAFAVAEEKAETPKERKALKRAEPSYKMEEDEDGVETGYVLINFKRKAVRYTKDGGKAPYRLALFDSVIRPLNPDEVELWGGSEIVISFRLVPFHVGSVGIGVSHRIEAVQVIKAVSGGDSRSGESYGFTKMDGFTGAPLDDEDEEDGEETAADETMDEEADGDF